MESFHTALIVGISGQTGSYLARELLSEGTTVVGTSRDADPSNLWRLSRLEILDQIRVESMSPHDFRSVYSVIEKIRPDSIYFLGGQSSVGLSFKQPFETFESISIPVMNILEAIRLLNLDTRFLNSASSDMFGNQPGTTLDESSPMRPVSPYGVAKLASYWTTIQYRDAFGLFASNAILSNHESPLRGSQFVTSKMVLQLKQVAEGQRTTLPFGNVSIRRDWLWAGDVARGIAEVLNHDKPDDFIIGSGESHSLLELIIAAGAALGVDAASVLTQNDDDLRPNEIESINLNPQKIFQETSWSPEVSFDELALRLIAGKL